MAESILSKAVIITDGRLYLPGRQPVPGHPTGVSLRFTPAGDFIVEPVEKV